MSADTQDPKQTPRAAEEDTDEKCPDCGALVRAKTMSEGGGVACTKCPWWFCY
jgi:ssDNA-binding Zn-finger/Zn-ribbon topoisomerase 1